MLPTLELANILALIYLFFQDGAKPILNTDYNNITPTSSKKSHHQNPPIVVALSAQKRRFDSNIINEPASTHQPHPQRQEQYGKMFRSVDIDDF